MKHGPRLKEIEKEVYGIEYSLGDQKKLMAFLGEVSLEEKLSEFRRVLANHERFFNESNEEERQRLLKRFKMVTEKLGLLVEKAKKTSGGPLTEEDLQNVNKTQKKPH